MANVNAIRLSGETQLALLRAAKRVYRHLCEHIEYVAMTGTLPVFTGIADLQAAIRRAERERKPNARLLVAKRGK